MTEEQRSSKLLFSAWFGPRAVSAFGGFESGWFLGKSRMRNWLIAVGSGEEVGHNERNRVRPLSISEEIWGNLKRMFGSDMIISN